jgi:hypothetical protein
LFYLLSKSEIKNYTKSQNFYEIISSLLKDSEVIKEIETKKEKLHIFDGITYFIENIEKLKPTYTPTIEDVLHTKQRTIGITSMSIEPKNSKKRYKIYDIGGQVK